MNVTKADYDELVRLREEYGSLAIYRTENGKHKNAVGIMAWQPVDDSHFAFMKQGDVLHIDAAIAEYERAQEDKP